MYRFGRSGNAAGVRDVSLRCGCSDSSVCDWTKNVIKALKEIAPRVMTWATEQERRDAKEWVVEKSGVDEWARGWCVLDGTHMPLAWCPATESQNYTNYKKDFTYNSAFIVLPHSMRIIEYVLGYPGSAHDSRVWAGGSQLLERPREHLDEGDFIWVDGGYGYFPFIVGPYPQVQAMQSRDLRTFNHNLSRIRVRVEHAIGYLKMRFQSLLAYRGNLYRDVDHAMGGNWILACVVAHTIAQQHDLPQHAVELLLLDGDIRADEAEEIEEDLRRNRQREAERERDRRRRAQAEYERDELLAVRQRGEAGAQDRRIDLAQRLREEMHVALFREMGWAFIDTIPSSRRRAMTTERYRNLGLGTEAEIAREEREQAAALLGAG